MKLSINAKSIDKLLEGGFESGIITEIYGEAGTGKTNICLQLTREMALLGKKVAYIDTEGVSVDRLEQICGDNYEQVVKNLLHYKPLSLEEQGKHINGLKKIPDLGLVIVDSVNIYTRMGMNSDPQVDRKFFGQVMLLQKYAREMKIPIIIISQVYSSGSDVQPFSGKTMAHIAKVIIRIDKVKSDIIGIGKRKAMIIKHRSIAEEKEAEFSLTGKGIE